MYSAPGPRDRLVQKEHTARQTCRNPRLVARTKKAPALPGLFPCRTVAAVLWTPSEAVVDARLHHVDLLIDVDQCRAEHRVGEAERLRAKIHVVVFDLGRPVRRE